MMFINSIFLPKNLSDQTLPEGVVNTIGNFSHLFANVFKFVKDGQENSNPIQLFPQTETPLADVQSELLKVSLLSDNKLVSGNSNLTKIVELFLSKIETDRFVKDFADSNKAKVSEKTPKDILLSKEDFVKEIKNLLDTLKDGEAAQLETIEISLISGGVSISINPNITSVAEIESLITEQLQSKDDFKILVQSGNQRLSLDVEQLKTSLSNSITPVEIISSNKQTETIKNNDSKVDVKSTQQTESENTNAKLNTIDTKISQSSVKPYKQALKEAFTSNQENVKKETQVTFTTNDKSTNGKQTAALNSNQTNIPKIKLENSNNEIQIPELDKRVENASVVSKKSINNFTSNNLLSENRKSETLKATEVNKTEKKISLKSNQKLNVFSLNKFWVEEKTELNDLVEKTDVKEIKVDVQNFKKKQNLNSPQQKIETKDEVVSEETNLDKLVTGLKVNTNLKTIVEAKTSKQNTPNKKLEVKSDLIESTESLKKKNVTDIKQEVKSENNVAAKTKPENKSLAQQELFNDNEIEFVDGEVVDSPKIQIKTERPLGLKIAQTTDSSKTVKSDFKSQDDNTVEKPVELEKSITYKNIHKVIDDLKHQGIYKKEQNLESKPELKKENSDWFKSKVLADYSENENFEKIVNKEKPEVQLKADNKSFEKDLTRSKVTTVENTQKLTPEISEQSKIKPVSIVKENFKQVDNPKFQTEEIISENVKTQSDVEPSKTLEQKSSEVKVNNVVKDITPVKIDFKERRVYAQIPKLEVISDEKPSNNLESSKLPAEQITKEKTQDTATVIKSNPEQFEAKPKDEKQVWVKVSFEQTDNEIVNEVKKTVYQQNKITIDANSDDVKKDFTPNSNSEKESHENPKQKLQTVSVETVQDVDQKPVVHNQTTTTNHNETSANVKPEIKSEQNVFKSELHNQETKFTSRQAEIVEKVKVISSGEMVREVYKVLENGEKQSVVLKLVPKELGAIKVVLDTIDNVLTARVEVENESVGQVIRNNVEQLRHNLAQSGVNVNSINISYQSSEQKQQGFNNQKKKNPAYFRNNEQQEVDENVVTKKLGYNTYEYLA